MSVGREERVGGAKGPKKRIRLPVVDTDVHEVFNSERDLLPFLAPQWHRYITDYGWNESRISSQPYVVPTGIRGRRTDARPKDGSRAGSKLELLQRQLLDEHNIVVAILVGFFHVGALGGWYEFATALASAYNDWQIATWLERDPRLRGSVHIVPHDPSAAVREIDRVGPHPQMVQVFLPVVSDRQWGDPMYRPIFAAAARHGLLIAMHHGGETRTAVGYPRYYIEWHTLFEQAQVGQLVSLLFNGVFEEFPELKAVALECGFSWLPHIMWKLDQQYRELRSEVPWLKRMPSEYFRDNVRCVTQPMDEISATQFEQLVDMMGSDQMVMFSSDYPHWDFDSPERALPTGLSESLRRRILYQNAVETYALGDIVSNRNG